jgi:signal transduction histidine kinase/CheY-like chemotaxis protein
MPQQTPESRRPTTHPIQSALDYFVQSADATLDPTSLRSHPHVEDRESGEERCDESLAGMLDHPTPTSLSRGHAPDYDPEPISLCGGGGFDVTTATANTSPAAKSARPRDGSRPIMETAPAEKKKKAKGVSIAQGSPEIIDTQTVINQYKERMARDLARRELAARTTPSPRPPLERGHPSPIREEFSLSPTSGSTSESDLPTVSTESNKTVRGGDTPAPTPGVPARTPSYPFPRMATPSYAPSTLQRAFNNQLQSGLLSAAGDQFESPGLQDLLRSDPSTPTSTMTFQPMGTTLIMENRDFPTPNMYDLVLMLGAEPGLDAWWSTVVQIMKECYKAERVTLSIPADATDLENVPWGQKATYNSLEDDDFSVGYMGRSSMIPSSRDDLSDMALNQESSRQSPMPVRPNLESRHSFTSYENKKESRVSRTTESPGQTPKRPGHMSRSKSYFPTTERRMPSSPRPVLNKQALEEHDAVEKTQPVPAWEAPLLPRSEVKGRVLPVLQGLDLEADPLIDHNGIKRVVERGKVIALTRNYPYLDSGGEKLRKKTRKPQRPDQGTKLSSLLGHVTGPRPSSRGKKTHPVDKSRIAELLSVLDDEEPRPPTPRFEEFEQAPPSPWSQSPAPSPAVRADPAENPFFTDAMVDEESFNPGPSPHDYSNIQPPETIGVDNSWTVLHVPLKHILLSKPAQAFKLNSAALEQKAGRGRGEGKADASTAERSSSLDSSKDPRQSPIAILSILTPVIPYPSNLRHSLEYLAPHLATSFSMCRHYSNLETEVSGLTRKRPSTTGFGALGPDGRPVADAALFAQLNYASLAEPPQPSLTSSLTSPSDYSAPNRSTAVSPGGSTGWDPSSFGLIVERRAAATSPGHVGSDSYFTPPTKPGNATADYTPRTPGAQPGRSSKEASFFAERVHRRYDSAHSTLATKSSATENQAAGSLARNSEQARDERALPVTTKNTATPMESVDPAQAEGYKIADDMQRTGIDYEIPGHLGQGSHKHTMLHSYGADFATTFQSLPPGSYVNQAPTHPEQAEKVRMLPPSDRLKGLMLDSLPAHVFVALPDTGEIVWVNSRYLSYRGQTVADLIVDPWGSIHPEDREGYIQNWNRSLRTGEQFAYTVRLRRFDGVYRWHQARAIASKDKRGVIVQFIGSYMDIHDQKIAELAATRQEEIEASEAKHRLLANLIPQIIFAATEEEGITFANEQWLSYTGQSFEDSLGLGFIDFVHPDDLAKCRIPPERPSGKLSDNSSNLDTAATSTAAGSTSVPTPKGPHSRESNSSNGSNYDLAATDLSELAKKGIFKVTTDSTGRLSYTTELRLRSKTGEYRWHLIRCVEINNINFGTGESSYFGSATDINDHKLLESKLKEAMESKSRFLSNMSHEIRTPLIGISGMVSFLQDTTLNEEQRDYTNTIQTSANSLLMIINDILDLSKVDAGMMKLSFEWFHTRSLIEDVNELVSTMAIAKGLELNYVVEEDVPSWVKGDKVRVRQVLLNVIGNAIKFTAKGEVFSRCKVATEWDRSEGEHAIMLEFSIIDTGRGFTKEEAELIFKPFSQIDGSSTRQHGGSGLGLVISRQLVELHGGKMDGTAVLGKGSTFTFTARFGLPTGTDYPDVKGTPPMGPSRLLSSEDNSASAIRPLLLQRVTEMQPTISPASDTSVVSPTLTSSAGSDPSVRSMRSQNTESSSVSSVNVGLVRFSEAAKASGQDLSQMKLEMPLAGSTPLEQPTSGTVKTPGQLEQFRPPMYSILIICPQTFSREATTKHIELTLPKDVPHQITALSSVDEALKLIGGYESVTFSHIVLNLPSAEEIIRMIDRIMTSSDGKTSVLVLSDSVQRQAVLKLASDAEHQKLIERRMINFIYKPVKPSRFAAVFDPAKSGAMSIDRNRSSAAMMVESQKQSYLDVEKRIGNKGFKVLLVEDNPVNQKVLVKYLKKVGIVAEIAADGVECTEAVFSHSPDYYSLILVREFLEVPSPFPTSLILLPADVLLTNRQCDLHMPRKDGYQACREIRGWEVQNNLRRMPIIALSANVMSDVHDKCVQAGFSDYVTKPVDFIDLSTAMSKFF